jgi:hypothetical protein
MRNRFGRSRTGQVEPTNRRKNMKKYIGGSTCAIQDGSGQILFGDALVNYWRSRNQRGRARVRAYYDVHPSLNSELTLDTSTRNRWRDPQPRIVNRLDEASQARAGLTKEHIHGVFALLGRANNVKILNTSDGRYLDHPAGGCRMGTDHATSVCNNYGQNTRSRESFCGRCADASDGGMRKRHSDLRRAHATFHCRDSETARPRSCTREIGAS